MPGTNQIVALNPSTQVLLKAFCSAVVEKSRVTAAVEGCSGPAAIEWRSQRRTSPTGTCMLAATSEGAACARWPSLPREGFKIGERSGSDRRPGGKCEWGARRHAGRSQGRRRSLLRQSGHDRAALGGSVGWRARNPRSAGFVRRRLHRSGGRLRSYDGQTRPDPAAPRTGVRQWSGEPSQRAPGALSDRQPGRRSGELASRVRRAPHL